MQFQSNKALCCDKIHRKNRYPRPDVSSLVEVGMTFQMTFRFATKQISNDRSTSSPAASTINDQTRKDLTMPRCSSVHNCAHQKAKTSRWAERIPDGITCPFGNNGKGALLLVIHWLPGATTTVENENRRKRQGYRFSVLVSVDVSCNDYKWHAFKQPITVPNRGLRKFSLLWLVCSIAT